MTVRAKFKLNRKDQYEAQLDAVHFNLEFTPVFADSEDNKSWSKWTPSGKLEMTVTNPDAVDQFQVGKSYYLDFTPAD